MQNFRSMRYVYLLFLSILFFILFISSSYAETGSATISNLTDKYCGDFNDECDDESH